MRFITKVAVLLLIVKLTNSAPDPCSLELNESSCDQTEYEAYKECVHNESKNDVRKKRQSPCPQNNLESLISIKENCQRANFDCRITCGEDENCQNQCPVCPINVDELIAASGNNTGEDHRTIVVESDQNVDKFQTINAAGNITTVIRLTNIINTTSTFSDSPQLDTDNLTTNETGGEFGLGSNANGSCCYVVHPKTCTSTSNGLRCHHRREKICGKLCTAKIVHAQVRKRCNSKGCHKKVAYVPQPKRPKCVHTRQWPYVSCGQSFTSTCDSCYDHYGYGYDENDDKDNDKDCEGCYDDAFDYGPFYRRGPVLRPYFYHAPPCYIMGTCYPYPLDCGYGCFDHQLIDPVWGYHHQRQHNAEYEDEEVDFEDVETDLENTVNGNKTGEGADDWAIEIHKCKVVSDNGTIEIRNCTSEDIEENPYAGAPSEDEDYEGYDDSVRIQRHTGVVHHSKAHRPHVVYVPVIENLNYDETASEEYDYDQAPRRRRPKRPKAHQRRNSFVYDDDDDNDPQN